MTGGILCMASMPCFDPNSFANGIGRIEWKMLNEDDHFRCCNKAVRGLYPPGSTVKPMVTMALHEAGRRSPDETVNCPGGLPARQPLLPLLDHGDARRDRYARGDRAQLQHLFLSMVHRVGYEKVSRRWRDSSAWARRFDLPGVEPALRHGARSGMEDAPLPAGMERVRHAQCGDRPGLCAGLPAAAGGDDRADRQRQRILPRLR